MKTYKLTLTYAGMKLADTTIEVDENIIKKEKDLDKYIHVLVEDVQYNNLIAGNGIEHWNDRGNYLTPWYSSDHLTCEDYHDPRKIN